MLWEIVRVALLVGVGVIIVALSRVLVELLTSGKQDVRDIREEGGGFAQLFSGELDGGQRKPSVARAHGVHAQVTRDGHLMLREKSVIARRAL